MKKIMAIQRDPNLTGTVFAVIDLSTVGLKISFRFHLGTDLFYSYLFFSEAEKATKRQELLTGKWKAQLQRASSTDNDRSAKRGKPTSSDFVSQDTDEDSKEDDDALKCAICYDLCVRPVTVSF